MSNNPPLTIGRYAIYDRIAAGGMATVYIGRLIGPVGFARTVAIKRLHPQFAQDAEFVTMFLDEARLAARIQHPNVVSTIDVVATRGELFLVMDYVRGEPVSALMRHVAAMDERVPPRIVAAIVSGALQGLYAAHTATDEAGRPLGIVHRDVSPQNILIGVDGTPRVLDFGVAKAENKLHSTRGGDIKGKLAYMPPEQLEGRPIDCTADIYAMGLLVYELLTGARMFQQSDEMASVARIIRNDITLPSSKDRALAAWDPIVRRAAAGDASKRYPTALAMALEVEKVVGIASPVEVAAFVDRLAGVAIKERMKRVAEIESSSGAGGLAVGQADLVDEIARASGPSLPKIAVQSVAQDETRVLGAQEDKSSISHSISAFAQRGTESRRRALTLGVGTTVGAAALLALFAFARPSRTTSRASDADRPSDPVSDPRGIAVRPTASLEASPPAPREVPSEVPTVAWEVPSTPPPAPRPAAPASIAAAPNAPAHPTRSSASTSVSQASAPTGPAGQNTPKEATSSKPNCDRPTTIDSAGHVHFRPECL